MWTGSHGWPFKKPEARGAKATPDTDFDDTGTPDYSQGSQYLQGDSNNIGQIRTVLFIGIGRIQIFSTIEYFSQAALQRDPPRRGAGRAPSETIYRRAAPGSAMADAAFAAG
jgi:hypothetical protein